MVPSVTSITPLSGYQTHGTTITITGSGFVNGATVNMVEESGGSPDQPHRLLCRHRRSGTRNTEITAITYPVPPTAPYTTYFVTVTTPAGASPYGPVAKDVFTFTRRRRRSDDVNHFDRSQENR